MNGMGQGEHRTTSARQACVARGPQGGLPWDVEAVSLDVGIPTPTLRTWDRRHEVGPSLTVVGGRRRYACHDVDLVRIMVHHIRRGLAPADAAAEAHAVNDDDVHRVSRELTAH